ncbi:RAT1 [Acrasis kona]|uniref:RAT1 n=1 Tax=Acrasis kona TaxID=1008807 RepID=A0AAW2YLR2_9EUKA
MGVSDFFPNIKNIFDLRSIVSHHNFKSRGKNDQFHSIYFDINSLLYPVAFSSYSQKQFFLKLLYLLRDFLSTHDATESVFFAVDGPGPRAKLITQRSRRYRKYIDDDSTLEEHELFLLRREISLLKKKQKKIDSRLFTPGTETMDHLKQVICWLAYRIIKTGDYKPNKSYVSAADHEGEGEYKIFEHLHSDLGKDINVKEKKKVLIVGGDSDLILYGLQSTKFCHLFVSQIDGSKYKKYDCNEIRAQLSQITNCKNVEQEERVIDDFCFLALLSGNDYVPKLKGYNFVKSWQEYLKYKMVHPDEFLVEISNENLKNPQEISMTLNQNMLKAIVEANIVGNFRKVSTPKSKSVVNYKNVVNIIFKKCYGKFPRYSVVPGDSVVVHLKYVHRLIGVGESLSSNSAEINAAQDALLGPSSGLYHLLNDDFGISESCYKKLISCVCNEKESRDKQSPQDQTTQLNSYLEGILWTLSYLKAQCLNFSFHFPYDSPQVSDLLKVDDKFITSLNHTYSLESCLTVPEFMMSVFNYGCRDHIPYNQIRDLMSKDSVVADLYHGDFDVIQNRWKEEDSIDRMRNAVRSSSFEMVPLQPTIRYSASGESENAVEPLNNSGLNINESVFFKNKAKVGRNVAVHTELKRPHVLYGHNHPLQRTPKSDVHQRRAYATVASRAGLLVSRVLRLL